MLWRALAPGWQSACVAAAPANEDVRQTLSTVVDDVGQAAGRRAVCAPAGPRRRCSARCPDGLHHLGLPVALYTDRAHWAVHTLTARRPYRSDPSDREAPAAPFARPRHRASDVQTATMGRRVNVLRSGGDHRLRGADACLTERFIADYDDEFGHPPADPTSAFVPCTASSSTASCASKTRGPSARTMWAAFAARSPCDWRSRRAGACAGLRESRAPRMLWPPLGAATVALLRPLRQPRPAPPARPAEKRARGLPQARRSLPPPTPTIPPPQRPGASTCPPVRTTERTDHLSKPSGHFTCQQQMGPAIFGLLTMDRRGVCETGVQD